MQHQLNSKTDPQQRNSSLSCVVDFYYQQLLCIQCQSKIIIRGCFLILQNAHQLVGKTLFLVLKGIGFSGMPH
jgi:hypothetical protein